MEKRWLQVCMFCKGFFSKGGGYMKGGEKGKKNSPAKYFSIFSPH